MKDNKKHKDLAAIDRPFIFVSVLCFFEDLSSAHGLEVSSSGYAHARACAYKKYISLCAVHVRRLYVSARALDLSVRHSHRVYIYV